MRTVLFPSSFLNIACPIASMSKSSGRDFCSLMSTSLVVCAAPRHALSHKRFFQIVVSDTAAAPVESPAGLIHASSLDLPTRVAQKHTHEVIHCKSCCMHSASHQLVRLSTVTQSLSHALALSASSQYAPSAVDIPIVIASCHALRPTVLAFVSTTQK